MNSNSVTFHTFRPLTEDDVFPICKYSFMLAHNEGGMSMPDLQALIDSRIPEHRNQLESNHANLHNVATYCETNYLNASDKSHALAETKQFAIQSLASVAYQINTMARDLLDMLELQTEKVGSLTNQVGVVNQIVNIHKEKLARREIGALTTNKTYVKQPKITVVGVKEPKQRYMRTPIDYSILDGIGHGIRVAEPPRNCLSTGGSSGHVTPHFHNTSSASMDYGERTATLGRSHLRSNYTPSIVPSDYRVPQINSMDPNRLNRHLSAQGSEYGDRSSGGGSGSNIGSTDFNIYSSDRYGTIRASNRASEGGNSIPRFNGAESPGLPLPPPQLSSQHYGGYIPPGRITQNDHYGTIRATNRNDLPPPPSSLLQQSMHEDIDDLPPPPESVSGQSAYGVFGIGNETTSNADYDAGNPEWVPEGEYIEKAIVLYDYEAVKADELTLRENAVVYVLRKNEDGWYEGVLDGVTGLFPGNYVQPM